MTYKSEKNIRLVKIFLKQDLNYNLTRPCKFFDVLDEFVIRILMKPINVNRLILGFK
jgi:hypothetical protein